ASLAEPGAGARLREPWALLPRPFLSTIARTGSWRFSATPPAPRPTLSAALLAVGISIRCPLGLSIRRPHRAPLARPPSAGPRGESPGPLGAGGRPAGGRAPAQRDRRGARQARSC